MTDVCLCFEVHQPFRLKKNFYWNQLWGKPVKKSRLFDLYFDRRANKEIFDRVSKKCYFPSNRIILELIDKYKGEKRSLKVAYSISGVFIDQCEMFNKDLIDSFRQLAETKCVEFIGQTYYHSLASLFEGATEFIEQVKMHKTAMKDLLKFETLVFENTELIYNNAIAKTIEDLGYKGILTEGIDRILGSRSPNYVYKPKNCESLKILLRNYRLTDDIGFRFSSRRWGEWPLTAEKYAKWLAATHGQYICIFLDYETFGEHHRSETGIFEFLRNLPLEIFKYDHLKMATPSEIVKEYTPVGEIDVFEVGGTVSWADLERDISSWLGDPMQLACYNRIKNMKKLVAEAGGKEVQRIWRYMQVSDHLHYMFTAGGAPGMVHDYFSPYDNPYIAFATFSSALEDFEIRTKLHVIAAKDRFQFSTGIDKFSDISVQSLKGFIKAIKKVDIKSLEFHIKRGDFENWMRFSLENENLANKICEMRKQDLRGRKLRNSLYKVVKAAYDELTRKRPSLLHG